jgi:hypothetical protein
MADHCLSPIGGTRPERSVRILDNEHSHSLVIYLPKTTAVDITKREVRSRVIGHGIAGRDRASQCSPLVETTLNERGFESVKLLQWVRRDISHPRETVRLKSCAA